MLSTVLIIDKRKELSVKYKKSIDDSEFRAVIAKNLKDGFSMLRELEPEMVIISDSIDEKLSDFCKKIRALTFNTRPIIIALSKSADISDRIEVLENGADDFLSEPVNTEEFKSRIKAHLRRDIELNLDSKTLLPNSKYVKKALKRLSVSENSAVLLASVQNLDIYSSVYTELAADKLVQTFIAIIKSALDENDFVGQLTDTDFIIITGKYAAEKLAEFLTFAFDTVVPKFYSESDSKRGYMLVEGNSQAGMRANFVSVLIGGMLEGFKGILNTDILMERLYEIKNLARIPSGSNYAIERVMLSGKGSVCVKNINKNIYIQEKDESLKYLLRTSLELQGYDITENIDRTSVEQPSVIIIDSGDNLEELDFCKTLKTLPNFVNTKIIVTSTVRDKAAVLDSGADLYLPKPYEIADLIMWVDKLYRNRF